MKVLEALIAKGRRVRRPREQREVAFGLADLSTSKYNTNCDNSHDRNDMGMLEKIVKKGGIKTLIMLLSQSTDVEAQQFSALAIANVASYPMNRNIICRSEENEAPREIIRYILRGKDQEETSSELSTNIALAQQYCAMALGNIAADPQTHDILVQLGVIDALILLLNKDDVDCARMAAFAFSNLAASRPHRKLIIEHHKEEIISPLISLACCDEISAQRKALLALRVLCIEQNIRVDVVRSGIIDPLVIIARASSDNSRIENENAGVLREVAAALNCLSCMNENKEEICDRAISTVISLMISNDLEVERHACCTIANLLEFMDIHERFLSEKGLTPMLSLAKSNDLVCKGEVSRAIANLSTNPKIQMNIIQEGVLELMVDALKKDDINCQRFAALCVANLSTTIKAQHRVMQTESIIALLVKTAFDTSNSIESRRYSILALANISATVTYHSSLVENGCLEAIFSLANFSADAMSQYYVSSALSNFSSNEKNHLVLIEKGGIQPMISLLFHSDPDVHSKAAAAIRGLSVSVLARIKIVQEGGLEPLTRLLCSRNVNTLREACAAICNLSLSDENKYEIGKSGAVAPLVALIQHEDMFIATQSSATLANLAEISNFQVMIGIEFGGVRPCISIMRSQYIEVQREAGRLMANLCASGSLEVTKRIVDAGGQHLLISLLLSDDLACQRVGSFGLGNLSTHPNYRVSLIEAGCLEPLCAIARCDDFKDMPIEISRFALLALANLTSSVETHTLFVDEDILPLLVSLSSSRDYQVRLYAAFAVAKLAENALMRKTITDEGGLESVLYLSRSLNLDVISEILPALANLSFIESNRKSICKYGGLRALCHVLVHIEYFDQRKNLFLACRALANLAEDLDIILDMLDSNIINLTISMLMNIEHPLAVTEGLRVLANLAANVDAGRMIMKDSRIISILHFNEESRDCIFDADNRHKMEMLLFANLSSCVENHSNLVHNRIIHKLVDVCKRESKCQDHETIRYTLLALANVSGHGAAKQIIVEEMIDHLHEFTKHRDAKIRHFAIFVVSNICTHHECLEEVYSKGYLKVLLDSAFPTCDCKDTQFQALSSLRSLGTHSKIRPTLLDEGVLEPLMLTCYRKDTDIELKREAAAAICNITLAGCKCHHALVRSGVISSLINVATETMDVYCQIFAIAAIANLAEAGGVIVSKRLLDEKCDELLVRLASISSHEELRIEISRLFAILTCYEELQKYMLTEKLIAEILRFAEVNEPKKCHVFAAISIGNIALCISKSNEVLTVSTFSPFLQLTSSDDTDVRISAIYVIHNLVRTEVLKNFDNKFFISIILALKKSLKSDDFDQETILMTLIAIRHVSEASLEASEAFFRDCEAGYNLLLKLAVDAESIEIKSEISGLLYSLSASSNFNKEQIVKSEEFQRVIFSLMHDTSSAAISRYSCATLANLAEQPDIQSILMEAGIIQHLKFVIPKVDIDSRHECLRALANMSSNKLFTIAIVDAGVLSLLKEGIQSEDAMNNQFSMIALRNLSIAVGNHQRIMEEDIFALVITVLNWDKEDLSDHQHNFEMYWNAISFISNISVSIEYHDMIKNCSFSITNMIHIFVESNDMKLKIVAAQFIANMSTSSDNHKNILQSPQCLDTVIDYLSLSVKKSLPFPLSLTSVEILHGLSAQPHFRQDILKAGAMDLLLDLARTDTFEFNQEVLSTICNLSLAGCIGENPFHFLNKIDIIELISYLCSSNKTHSLFGALSIGNIVSKETLHEPVIAGGALNPLINVSHLSDDFETRRCIAYGLCNLLTDERNHQYVTENGGLPTISILCTSKSVFDCRMVTATLRSLSFNDVLITEILDTGIVQHILHESGTIKSDPECRENMAALISSVSMWIESKRRLLKNSTEIINFLAEIAMVGEFDRHSLKYCISAIANFCENNEWHFPVLQTWTLQSTIHYFNGANEVIREMLRFFANLSYNMKTHEYLIGAHIPDILCSLCDSIDNELSCDYIVICFTNLSNAIDCKLKAFSSILEIIKNGYKFPNACLGLCSTYCSKVSSGIDMNGLLGETINQYIRSEDMESRRYSSFLLSMICNDIEFTVGFTENHVMFEIVQGVLQSLINASKECPHAVLYMVASLRKLTVDKTIQRFISRNENDLRGIFCIPHIFEKNVDICLEFAALLCNFSSEAHTKHMIAQSSSMLQTCLFLCQSCYDEIVRLAITTIANTAEDESFHKTIMADNNTNLMHDIMRLLNHSSTLIYREASRAISSVLSSTVSHSTFIAQNGLRKFSRIVSTLSCVDHECLFNIALSLRKLAAHRSNHRSMFDEKLYIVKMLDKLSMYDEFTDVQLMSMNVLVDLSWNAKEYTDFGENSNGLIIVQCSRRCCFHENIEMRVLALHILRRLLCSASLHLAKQICSDNILFSILECTRKSKEDILLEYCSQIIGVIIEHAEIQMSLIHNETFFETLYELQEKGNYVCKRSTSKIICWLSSNAEIRDQGQVFFGDREMRLILSLLSNCNDSQCFEYTSLTLCNLLVSQNNFAHKTDSVTLLALLRILVTRSNESSDQSSKYICLAIHRMVGNNVTRSHLDIEDGSWLMKALLKFSRAPCIDTTSYALMSQCSLLLSRYYHKHFIELRGVEILLGIIRDNLRHECCQYALMTLLNFTAYDESKSLMTRTEILTLLLEKLRDNDLKIKILACQLLGNLLSSNGEVQHHVLTKSTFVSDFVTILSSKLSEAWTPLKRALLLSMYNLSHCIDGHSYICEESVPSSLVGLCESDDVCCRRLSIMTLCNLASNPITRQAVTKGRGLQKGILLLTDDDIDCQRYACIYLANISNDYNTKQQIVVHGALKRLFDMGQSSDEITRYFALITIANVAGNEFSHKKFTPDFLRSIGANVNDQKLTEITGILVGNLAFSRQMSRIFDDVNNLKLLFQLSTSNISHLQCFALSALRSLAAIPNLHAPLYRCDVLSLVNKLDVYNTQENLREFGGLLCNLSLTSDFNKLDISNMVLDKCMTLVQSKDEETMRQGLSTLANLSEDVATHDKFIYSGLLHIIPTCLSNASVHVVREALRCVSNVATSINCHSYITSCCLKSVIQLSKSSDTETLYYLALTLRKIAINRSTHFVIVNGVVGPLLTKFASVDNEIKYHIAVLIRDLAGNEDMRLDLANHDIITVIAPFLRMKDTKIQTLLLSILRHLSIEYKLKHDIIKCGVISTISRYVSKAADDFKHQSAAILANTSELASNQVLLMDQGSIPALITLHRSDYLEIKMDCARAFANLSTNEKCQLNILLQGGIDAIFQLSHENNYICQTYVATSLRFLMTNIEVRQSFIQNNSIENFIRLANSKNSDYQQTAAVSFAALSLNEKCRNCLIEPTVITACTVLIEESKNSLAQKEALNALANVCEIFDSHKLIMLSGCISFFIGAFESWDDEVMVRDMTRLFASISFNEDMKVPLYQYDIMSSLYRLARSCDLITQRLAMVAICNICQSSEKGNILNTPILDCLHFLVRFQDMTIERCSALSFASLALGNFNQSKLNIARDNVAIKALVNMVEFPDKDVKLCALIALNAIVLGEHELPKLSLMEDKNNLSKIANILSSNNSDELHCAIYLLGSLSENDEVKDAIVELGVIQNVVKHSEEGSIEIKRVSCYFLALLAANQVYHKHLELDGALPAIISISSCSDIECQEYAAFAIAYLASNRNYQMTMVKLGVVRPLVSMMATEAESKHYAGLALLKLADNYETHLKIAEEGGIQALLSMGRNRTTDEDLCYKTALTVGSLASNAVKFLPNL